jgi:DNA (cytosine-5)-methyltransferase 1
METLRTGAAEMAPREVKKLEPDALADSRSAGSPPIPWPPEPSERCDFYHRSRTFPKGVQTWRRRLVARVMENRHLFPCIARDATHEEVRALVDEGITFLREISRLTALLHGSPRLGTKEDTVDEPVLPVDTHVGRVLARLGPYRELGLSLAGLDHKQLQTAFADLVPPNLRQSLHVNLLIHGQDVCKSLRPLCDRCEIRNFCSTFRDAEVKRAARSKAPTVVDLFAGSGGLSEGFIRAGARVILALDQDPVARRTYWLNHPSLPDNRLLGMNVRDLKAGQLRKLAGRNVDILVGAPPCQGFSHAGFRSKRTRTDYRLTADERNFLFEHMVSAALELRPRLFLMENVPGMHSARKENLSFLEIAARMLEEKGRYRTAIWRLNASAFGVPQDRIRYFLVASRLGMLPTTPHEEYQDIHQREFDVDALPPVTLEEAIFDLPPRSAGGGVAVEPRTSTEPTSDSRSRRYLSKFALLRPSRLIFNHTVRYNNGRDLELYALLRPGEDSIHALERYGRDDLMRYRRDVFDDKYARLRADRPSKTIVSHLAKDGNGYIHPSQVRSISIREAARLQSFHDEYRFCGTPSDQWIQIGNAVPPILAETIAKSFLRLLQKGDSE